MILFKDIKQNYPVYILDTQEFDIIQGKATQVSFPRLEMNQKTGKTEMVVDVTIEANGKIATYTIPENHSVTYAGHLVLATEKPGLASEVEAQKASAEQVLASASKAQKIIKKELQQDPSIILDNITEILKGLSKEETKITLRVNPVQVSLLKAEIPDVLNNVGLEAKVLIVPDETIIEGGCMVTTTNGVIDATIETQLSVISEALKEI